jgi:hypothetical protein
MVLQGFPEKKSGCEKPAAFIEQENSVETGLSLAKLHACIALLCLVRQHKIIKTDAINTKRLPGTPTAGRNLQPGR